MHSFEHTSSIALPEVVCDEDGGGEELLKAGDGACRNLKKQATPFHLSDNNASDGDDATEQKKPRWHGLSQPPG